MLFTFVFAAIATITCSATQRCSWLSSISDDVCLTNPQVSKYPASKYPTTSWPVNVGSWPTC